MYSLRDIIQQRFPLHNSALQVKFYCALLVKVARE